MSFSEDGFGSKTTWNSEDQCLVDNQLSWEIRGSKIVLWETVLDNSLDGFVIKGEARLDVDSSGEAHLTRKHYEQTFRKEQAE